IHESRAGFGSADQFELEADHFAAGLLMPGDLFAAAASRYSDGMEAIKGLADDCKTSLTASAIRYAELTDAAVAIVISQGATVDYCMASDALRRVRGYRHLKKGADLPRESYTRHFNQDQANVTA